MSQNMLVSLFQKMFRSAMWSAISEVISCSSLLSFLCYSLPITSYISFLKVLFCAIFLSLSKNSSFFVMIQDMKRLLSQILPHEQKCSLTFIHIADHGDNESTLILSEDLS